MMELRHGLRALLRRPGLAAWRTGLLALGIASSLAAFSVVDGLTTDPAGTGDARRLVAFGRNSVSYPDFDDLQQRLRSFSRVTAWATVKVGIARDGGTQQVRAALVSGGYFEVFRVRAIRGRLLGDRDSHPTAARAVVISEGFWRTAFGSDETRLGQSIEIAGVPFSIVGVISGRFKGPTLEYVPDLWVPLSQEAAVRPALATLGLMERRSARWLGMTGRLADAATFESAAAEVDTVVQHLKREYPREHAKWRLALRPLAVDAIPADVVESVVSVASILTLVGAIALAIGAATNCILLLMGSDAKRSEIAVRRSIGATGRHLVRMLLVDNGLVGGAGAALGVLLAFWYLHLVDGVYVTRLIPLAATFRVTVNAVVCAFGLAFALPVAVGLLPLRGAIRDSAATLLGRAAGATRPHVAGAALVRLFVIVQIALAVMLVSGALALQAASRDREAAALNFDPEKLVIIPLEFGGDGRGVRLPVIDAVKDRLSRIPSVVRVAWAAVSPLGAVDLVQDVRLAGGGDVTVSGNEVDPGYFETLGLTFVAGAPFQPGDVRGVVINESAARLLWPASEAVGADMQLASAGSNAGLRVNGVVRDSKYFTLEEQRRPYVYFPSGSTPIGAGVLLVRTRIDPASVFQTIRREIAAVDRAIPVGELMSMSEHLATHRGRARFLALNTSLFSGLAAAAAVAGLFGSVAQMARRRRKEIGIRLALGATPGQSARPLMVDALLVIVLGLGAGEACAIGFGGVLAHQLYGVTHRVPSAIVAATLLVALCCLAAVAVPVARARNMDAAPVLKSD